MKICELGNNNNNDNNNNNGFAFGFGLCYTGVKNQYLDAAMINLTMNLSVILDFHLY